MRVVAVSMVLLGAVASCGAAGPNLPVPDSARLDWWQTALIYQMYPLSFKDGDGDGYGDFRGVLEKLDYVKELGADAVWFTPINKSPDRDWTYDVSNYTSIHTLFGTMEDFDAVISKMNKLGLKFIFDYVPDYCSDQIEWFQKSKEGIEPYSDYYIWHPGYYNNDTGVRSVPNNWGTVFGGPAWTWVDSRQKYYWHVFTPQQPELNWRSGRLVADMKDVLRFWLDKGVSGFRVDSVSRLFEDAQFRNNTNRIDYTLNQPETYDMVTQYRALLDEYTAKKGDFTRFMMLETTGSLAKDVGYFGNKTNPGGHLPFIWEFMTAVHSGANANSFNVAINNVMASVPSGNWYIWFSGNHDNYRVATRVPGLEDAVNLMQLLLPGAAITYMGEEMGMTDNLDITYSEGVDPQGCNAGAQHYIQKTRDRARTPLQWDNTTNAGFSAANKTWLPVNKNYVSLNIAAQEAAANSHLKVYKRAAQLRRVRAIQRGALHNHAISTSVFAYSRELKGEPAYIVVVNTGSATETVSLSTAFSNLPTAAVVEIAGVDSGFQEGDSLSLVKISLKGKAALVLRTGKI
ncbi:maltase 2-like [Bacillus rossius redtenbacheri]|uniref:maltase 2-like n=1 Tax=Bacillus rossius redtenbacheri TaxID=93214 RepID=UPI002FDCA0F7